MRTIHKMGVIHADLEPRNVVMDEIGNLRVIDFEMSSMDHRCSLPCDELLGLGMGMGMEPAAEEYIGDARDAKRLGSDHDSPFLAHDSRSVIFV
jgi:serine/threonine protein kinase